MKIKRKQPAKPQERRLKAADVVGVSEAETQELAFDPDLDVTSEDWREMIWSLGYTDREEKERRRPRLPREEVSYRFRLVADIDLSFPMLLLSSDRTTDSLLSSEVQQGIREKWRKNRLGQPPGSARILYAAKISRLFHKDKGDLEINDSLWEESQQDVERLGQSKILADQYAELARGLIMLFPDKRDGLVTEARWQLMKTKLEEYRLKQNWYSFSQLAADMALLAPERKPELRIDNDTWGSLRDDFKKQRENPGKTSFAKMALAMTILAAEHAEITASGRIEIIKKRPRLSSSRSLPDRPPIP